MTRDAIVTVRARVALYGQDDGTQYIVPAGAIGTLLELKRWNLHATRAVVLWTSGVLVQGSAAADGFTIEEEWQTEQQAQDMEIISAVNESASTDGASR